MVRHTLILIFLVICSCKVLNASPMHESPHEPWGVDASLANCLKKSNLPSSSVPSLVCQSMIRFFQVYISPIDGPRSHFYPTSSEYARQAIQKYGVLKGIAMGCDRLMRENSESWTYPITKDYGINRKLDPVR